MNKRLYKKELLQYDLANDTCFVRELEMVVEGGLKDSAYSIQFWDDMQTYGLREAVVYVLNGNHHYKPTEVVSKANEILRLFGRRNIIQL